MKQVEEKIHQAQQLFREKLESVQRSGGLSQEQYVRFLQMQYHLTKGVQRHFHLLAAHPDTAKRRELRKWLVQFAQEEEFHYLIAQNDLKNLGADVGEAPFDTELWWLYFDSILPSRPFTRLGATCILENIGNGSADILDQLIASSAFMTAQNTRFMQIHRHGPNLDHGNQVLDALRGADLNAEELSHVLKGADLGTAFYLRLTHWVLTGENLR